MPVVLLGLPLEAVENPYLVVPSGKVMVSAYVKEGCKGIKLRGYDDGGLTARFWDNLVKGLGLPLCAELEILEVPQQAPGTSIYAAITSALTYVVARSHGEILDELEIVEIARMSDPWTEPWWQGAIDALRYSSATGRVVAYRNDEESGELAEGQLNIRSTGRQTEAKANVRDFLGPEVFDVLIHLVGHAVLAAGDDIREKGIVKEKLERWTRVQRAAAYLAYGLEVPGEGCWWTPGIPRRFELVCAQ